MDAKRNIRLLDTPDGNVRSSKKIKTNFLQDLPQDVFTLPDVSTIESVGNSYSHFSVSMKKINYCNLYINQKQLFCSGCLVIFFSHTVAQYNLADPVFVIWNKLCS